MLGEIYAAFFVGLPNWVVSLIVLALMVIVGLIAHYVLYTVAARIARRTLRPLDDLLVKHSAKPVRLLAPLVLILHAWSVNPPAPELAFVGERVLGTYPPLRRYVASCKDNEPLGGVSRMVASC